MYLRLLMRQNVFFPFVIMGSITPSLASWGIPTSTITVKHYCRYYNLLACCQVAANDLSKILLSGYSHLSVTGIVTNVNWAPINENHNLAAGLTLAAFAGLLWYYPPNKPQIVWARLMTEEGESWAVKGRYCRLRLDVAVIFPVCLIAGKITARPSASRMNFLEISRLKCSVFPVSSKNVYSGAFWMAIHKPEHAIRSFVHQYGLNTSRCTGNHNWVMNSPCHSSSISAG